MDWKDISEQLSAPFPVESIHWRVGATNGDKTKGIALAYIDARDVFDRLDSVVGPENWQTSIMETAKGRVLCSLTIHGVTKTDGAGDTDMEGEKGGISDSIKRAAVQFGVGRYLYRLPNVWVPVKPAGKSYKLAEVPSLPSWAIPAGTAKPVAKPKAKAAPKAAPPEEDEHEKFLGAVRKLLDEGASALGQADMDDRLLTILAFTGKGYDSIGDITEREDQVAFYQSLKSTISRAVDEAAA